MCVRLHRRQLEIASGFVNRSSGDSSLAPEINSDSDFLVRSSSSSASSIVPIEGLLKINSFDSATPVVCDSLFRNSTTDKESMPRSASVVSLSILLSAATASDKASLTGAWI